MLYQLNMVMQPLRCGDGFKSFFETHRERSSRGLFLCWL